MPIIETDFDDYLADESRFRGYTSTLDRAPLFIPPTVKLTVKYTVSLTVVSGKTSLTGAPVPLGGVIIDVAGLDFIDPEDPSEVGPGTILKRYRNHLDKSRLILPTDPTSADSCICSGNVVCNASGVSATYMGQRAIISAA